MVEKILAPHEQLRADWPVEGTTGYDYLNWSLGLLVDPSAEDGFTETYSAFTGVSDEFEEMARDGKLRIMDNEMASELNALGRAAARLAGRSPMTADLTRSILQRAIKQVVANFPVYRTYVDLTGSPPTPIGATSPGRLRAHAASIRTCIIRPSTSWRLSCRPGRPAYWQ